YDPRPRQSEAARRAAAGAPGPRVRAELAAAAVLRARRAPGAEALTHPALTRGRGRRQADLPSRAQLTVGAESISISSYILSVETEVSRCQAIRAGWLPAATDTRSAAVERASSRTARAAGETRRACLGSQTPSAPGVVAKRSGGSSTIASPSIPTSIGPPEPTVNSSAVHSCQPAKRCTWPAISSIMKFLALAASLTWT